MYKTALMIAGLMFLSPLALAQDRTIQKDYPLTKLTDKVYVIHGPNEEVSKENQAFRNNPVIIKTSKGLVVVDPGSSRYIGEMVVRKAKQVSSQPIIAVFDTHDHGDHYLGNDGIKRHYPKAVIYAHKDMKEAIERGDGDMWVKAINKRSDNAIEGTKVVAPEKTVADGDVLKFGDITIKVIHAGPGHSRTDIMLQIVEEKVLVFGDLLREGNASPFMSSFAGNLKALELGENMDIKIYIPGHGPSGDASMIGRYREFIVTLKNEVKKYYDQGLTDFEMKPKVVKALKEYKDWSSMDESIGRLINLAYLEVENESF